MTQRRANVLRLMSEYCVLGYELTLLEIHKLLYFLQVAGEPLQLRFTQGHYGPYADNLRHVLNQFEGHFLEGFGDGRNGQWANRHRAWETRRKRTHRTHQCRWLVWRTHESPSQVIRI